MLRAYFVHEYDDPLGFAVIAESSREAKKIAFYKGDFSGEWTDLRVNWIRYCNIDGLKKGLVTDTLDGIRRKIYAYAEDSPCDVCGKVGYVEEYKGNAVCYECLEREDIQ